MIDLKKANEEFDKYVKNYNSEDKKIALKIEHIKRVSEISGIISENLNLDKENIELAKLIGLLHDIGRFEQIKQYNTFSDKDSIDHGKLGVEILFKQGKIRNFIKSAKYDEIIKKAILNHNRKEIEKGLNPKELLHSKIIRDADKLDSFRAKYEDDIYTMANITQKEIETSLISDNIFNDFISEKTILNKDRKTPADIWISYIAFIYGLYFKESLLYIKENNYINKLIDRFHYVLNDTKEKMEKIRNKGNKYIKRV